MFKENMNNRYVVLFHNSCLLLTLKHIQNVNLQSLLVTLNDS